MTSPDEDEETGDLTPPPHNLIADSDRRTGDRRQQDRTDHERLITLEWRFRELRANFSATTEAVRGLGSTIESRLKAFESEQRLMLEKLSSVQRIIDRAEGGWNTIKVLGILALASGLVAIFVGIGKMLNGGK